MCRTSTTVANGTHIRVNAHLSVSTLFRAPVVVGLAKSHNSVTERRKISRGEILSGGCDRQLTFTGCRKLAAVGVNVGLDVGTAQRYIHLYTK